MDHSIIIYFLEVIYFFRQDSSGACSSPCIGLPARLELPTESYTIFLHAIHELHK